MRTSRMLTPVIVMLSTSAPSTLSSAMPEIMGRLPGGLNITRFDAVTCGIRRRIRFPFEGVATGAQHAVRYGDKLRGAAFSQGETALQHNGVVHDSIWQSAMRTYRQASGSIRQ